MSERIPSGRELEILKILWDTPWASVREVHERMCPAGELAYNTVQTLLRIMDEKGLVTHQLRGRTFVYRSKHSRDREMSRLLDKVFDGALDQFVVSLVLQRSAPGGAQVDLGGPGGQQQDPQGVPAACPEQTNHGHETEHDSSLRGSELEVDERLGVRHGPEQGGEQEGAGQRDLGGADMCASG